MRPVNPSPTPAGAHLVQCSQAILIGQVGANPTAKELTDCKKRKGKKTPQELADASSSRPQKLKAQGTAKERDLLRLYILFVLTREEKSQRQGLGKCVVMPGHMCSRTYTGVG